MASKFDTRQSKHRSLLRKIANRSDYAANSATELDNLMVAVNDELSPAFELYPNHPSNLILNIGPNFVTNTETSVRHSNSPINKQFPSFTSGTVTLPAASGGVITVSPTIVANPTLTISANAFIKALIECDSLGNLSVTLGSEGATEALAGNPGINSKAFQIGLLVIQTVAGVVQNVTGSRIVQFQGGGGSGSGTGDGVLEPIDGYQWLETDNFDVIASASDSKVTTTNYTNATQDLGKGLYNIKCDKSRTVATSSGTSLTISAAPSFTVQVGDIVYLTSGLRADQWRRIATVNSQTDFVLDAVLTGGNATAGDTLMVSQAIWTKDLVNLGDAAQQTRARDFLSGNITQIAIDYFDSLTAGDDVADQASAARVAVSASNEGLLADTAVPLSSEFSPIYQRPTGLNSINDYVLSTNTDQERLHLVFFASPTNGSVTAECNLLRYDVSFYDQPYIDNGGAINSAFCMSNGSGTEINCSAPTVLGGKTRVQLDWSYVAGVNPGTTRGQLQIFVDGSEIPRFVSGATLDGHYTEIINPVTQVYDIVEFWTDLSSSPLSIEIIQGAGVIDTSSQNTADLLTLKNTAFTAEAYRQSLDSFVRSESKLTPINGSPGPGQYRSEIQNREPIIDLANDLAVRIGKRRISTAFAVPLSKEFGPNNEQIFSILNDTQNQVRLAGQWQSISGNTGMFVRSNVLNSFVEVVFWGTGLNLLTIINGTGPNPDIRASVDGAAEGSNFWIDGNGPNTLSGRNNNLNQIINVTSGLSQGLHTVRIRLNNSPTWALDIYGFEILNESTTLNVRPGVGYPEGAKATLASAQTPAVSSGFYSEIGTPGTRGGKVVVYLTQSGEIRKAIQWTNASQQDLAAADHANEQIERTYHWREFGTNLSDDFRTLVNSTSTRAAALDDGNVSLLGSNVRAGDSTEGDVLLPNTSTNSFITISFIGTGLDIIRGADIGSGAMDANNISINGGASIGSLASLGVYNNVDFRFRQKIVSGLPYGQHTVRFTRTAVSTSIFSIAQFIVYAPKAPAVPVGSMKLAEYNIPADYVAAGSGLQAASSGVIRHHNTREFIYVNGTGGSNWVLGSVDALSNPAGFGISSNHQNSYIQYEFWGTGFEYRGSTNTNRSSNIAITLNGLAATSANFATATAANIGSGSFNFATGVLNMNAALSFNSGFSIRNLPLARYMVRINQAAASTANTFMDISSFDIIAPCHSIAKKEPNANQNNFDTGSVNLMDARRFSGSETLRSTSKNITKIRPISSSASTTSTALVPLFDMTASHFSQTGRIRITYCISFVHTQVAGPLLTNIRINGGPVVLANDANSAVWGASLGANTQTVSQVVDVQPGWNNVSVMWRTTSGTLSADGLSRFLTIEDI